MDFESGGYALAAVKALQGKGIQAQMARVGITTQNQHERSLSVRACNSSHLSFTFLSSGHSGVSVTVGCKARSILVMETSDVISYSRIYKQNTDI